MTAKEMLAEIAPCWLCGVGVPPRVWLLPKTAATTITGVCLCEQCYKEAKAGLLSDLIVKKAERVQPKK